MQNLAIGLVTRSPLAAGLFRVCLPRSGGKPRWFIGTLI